MIRSILKTAFFCGSIYLAYVIGGVSALDSEYKINRFDNGVSIESKSLNKSYQLQILGGDLFLGSLEHQMEGVKKLYFQEQMGTFSKQQKRQPLKESMLTHFDTKAGISEKIKKLQDGVWYLVHNTKQYFQSKEE